MCLCVCVSILIIHSPALSNLSFFLPGYYAYWLNLMKYTVPPWFFFFSKSKKREERVRKNIRKLVKCTSRYTYSNPTIKLSTAVLLSFLGSWAHFNSFPGVMLSIGNFYTSGICHGDILFQVKKVIQFCISDGLPENSHFRRRQKKALLRVAPRFLVKLNPCRFILGLQNSLSQPKWSHSWALKSGYCQ